MKRIKLFLAALTLLLGVGAGLVPVAASAASTPKASVCDALGSDATCSTNPEGSPDLNNLVRTVINIFSVVIGVVAVIMIMLGGFRYITSGGDSNKITSAKSTLIYAVVGLIIVALAQTIVVFVLRQVKGCPSGQVLNNTTGLCQAAKKGAFLTSSPLYAIMYKG